MESKEKAWSQRHLSTEAILCQQLLQSVKRRLGGKQEVEGLGLEGVTIQSVSVMDVFFSKVLCGKS